MLYLEARLEFSSRDAPFAYTAVPQGVDQRQAFIQKWILERCMRNFRIERFQLDPTNRAFRMRPHGRRLSAGGDVAAERGRCV